MQRALAEALGRTLNGVDWKIDGMASNLDEFRTANENPLGLNVTEVKLLADYLRDPVKVAERCRLSYERLVAGESPAALTAERRRARQDARTCDSCFTEFAADGSCMCM